MNSGEVFNECSRWKNSTYRRPCETHSKPSPWSSPIPVIITTPYLTWFRLKVSHDLDGVDASWALGVEQWIVVCGRSCATQLVWPWCWHQNSWPGPAPPHWLSQKRNRAHVKPPSLSYCINFISLHRPGGLMVSMLVGMKSFSQVVMSSVFNSWGMYIFCGALPYFSTSFWLLFTSYWYFIFSYVLLWFLLDIMSSGLTKIALISQ